MDMANKADLSALRVALDQELADFDAPLAVTVTSGQDEPVTGGQVTFTGPASGAGLDGAPLAATIDAEDWDASVRSPDYKLVVLWGF